MGDRVGNGYKAGDWSSSGRLLEPSLLKAGVAIGDATKTIARTGLSVITESIEGHFDGITFGGGLGISPAFRSNSWEHSWYCDFGVCHSKLTFDVFWINEQDGSVITWDSVELGVQASDQRVTEADIGSREYYRQFDRTGVVTMTWDKYGHDPDFNVGFKLWKGGVWWFWQAWSHA